MADLTTVDITILQQLPQAYKLSRLIQPICEAWQPVLDRKMGRYLDLVKEGIIGLSDAKMTVLKDLAQFERDDTAQLIVREFLNEKLPGVFQLLHEISPQSNEYENHFMKPTAVEEDWDDMDSRSFTMGPEPITPPTSILTRTVMSMMGPPPHTNAPTAPMTPTEPSNDRFPIQAGPSCIRSGPADPTSHGTYNLLTSQQKGKRPLDVVSLDEQQTSDSPRKRPRATVRFSTSATTQKPRTIVFAEVQGQDYIFKDHRCGEGWYIIRCNLSELEGINKPFSFSQHPLESSLAMNHFNSNGFSCHESDRNYTVEDIIQGFSYRGKQFQNHFC